MSSPGDVPTPRGKRSPTRVASLPSDSEKAFDEYVDAVACDVFDTDPQEAKVRIAIQALEKKNRALEAECNEHTDKELDAIKRVHELEAELASHVTAARMDRRGWKTVVASHVQARREAEAERDALKAEVAEYTDGQTTSLVQALERVRVRAEKAETERDRLQRTSETMTVCKSCSMDIPGCVCADTIRAYDKVNFAQTQEIRALKARVAELEKRDRQHHAMMPSGYPWTCICGVKATRHAPVHCPELKTDDLSKWPCPECETGVNPSGDTLGAKKEAPR